MLLLLSGYWGFSARPIDYTPVYQARVNLWRKRRKQQIAAILVALSANHN